MNHILVVDDEADIREITCAYLKQEGFLVSEATNSQEAIEIFESSHVDLLVLDLMTSKISGEEVYAHIRKKSNVPIIMLRTKGENEDVIKGIANAADDYLIKPFSVRKLVIRINAIFGRLDGDRFLSEVKELGDGDLYIDFGRMIFLKRGKAVSLTPNEYKILKILIANAGMVLNREQIIEMTFGSHFDGFDRTIDTHIKNIRSKIEDDPKKPMYIKTIYSLGYKFMDDQVV